MYCPFCGHELTKIADAESRKAAWDDYSWSDHTDEENVAHIGSQPTDRSTHYACTGCRRFAEGYPLVHHHCFDHEKNGHWGGVHCHGKPGDSWSFTWIK